MKKALIFVVLLFLTMQVNAYMLTLRRPGDTTRMIIDKSVNTDSIQEMINSGLQLNRAGCNPRFFGKCRTYLDFPIAYATLRVYAGIERVLVWETEDYRGIRWLNFKAYGYASSGDYSYSNYSYYNTSQSKPRFTYYRILSRSLRPIGYYYNAYTYRRYLIG